MTWIALVGPEIEENLSLRYIASSLAQAGLDCEIIAFNHDGDFAPGLRAILDAQEPPLLVGLSLAFQWRAQDFIAFGLALRDHPRIGTVLHNCIVATSQAGLCRRVEASYACATLCHSARRFVLHIGRVARSNSSTLACESHRRCFRSATFCASLGA